MRKQQMRKWRNEEMETHVRAESYIWAENQQANGRLVFMVVWPARLFS